MVARLASPTPLPDRPVGELAGLVHRVVRASLHRLSPVLGEEGITMGQFWALHFVSSRGGTSVGAVARTLGVSPPTACASLDQLEAAGLLRRTRSERDHRSVELSLTPRGGRAEARVWAEVGRLLADAATGLAASDLTATVRVLRAIERRMEPVAPRGVERP